jgi:hypothetical protein
MAQAAARHIITNDACQEDISAQRTSVDRHIGCATGDSTLLIQFQDQDRGFARDTGRIADQVFISHHVTDDQYALTAETINERAQTRAAITQKRLIKRHGFYDPSK